MSAGRDVTVRRVPNAGHGLSSPGPGGAPDFSQTDREFRLALDWFWSVPLR